MIVMQRVGSQFLLSFSNESDRELLPLTQICV
jgi:hypothetical protein